MTEANRGSTAASLFRTPTRVPRVASIACVSVAYVRRVEGDAHRETFGCSAAGGLLRHRRYRPIGGDVLAAV